TAASYWHRKKPRGIGTFCSISVKPWSSLTVFVPVCSRARPSTAHGANLRACTRKIAIGDSELIKSALAHFADSSRTSPEVREVPIDDITLSIDHKPS